MTHTTELALDLVATYRLTRLVTKDVLTQDARDRIIRSAYANSDAHRPALWPTTLRAGGLIATGAPSVASLLDGDRPGAWQRWAEDDDNPPKLATLITCRWCAGMWIAFLVAALRIFAPRPWSWVARALTASAVAALLARLETD